MESVIVLCFVTIICILVNSGEGYFIHRNRNDKDKRKDNDVVHNNENVVQRAPFSRGVQLMPKVSDKGSLARKEAEASVEELLNTFKTARRFRLNKKVTGRGWWFCDWCDGSKLIRVIADLLKCKCYDSEKIKCKCPNGEILTQDMFEKERFST